MKNLFNRKSVFKSKRQGKNMDRVRSKFALQNEQMQDELPSQSGMKAKLKRHEERQRGIASIGPVRRFLDARVGQPIAIVESDLRKRAGKRYIDRSELIQIFDRLVVKEVELEEDGIYARHFSAVFRMKLTQDFYVHPLSLTLEKVPSEVKPVVKPLFEQVKINDKESLVLLDGLWFMISFKPLLPKTAFLPSYLLNSPPADIILKRDAIDFGGIDQRYHRYDPFVEAWGAKVYAASKRAASKFELRKAGIR